MSDSDIDNMDMPLPVDTISGMSSLSISKGMSINHLLLSSNHPIDIPFNKSLHQIQLLQNVTRQDKERMIEELCMNYYLY